MTLRFSALASWPLMGFKRDGFWVMPAMTVHSESVRSETSLLKYRPYNESYKIVSDWEEFLFEFMYNQRFYQPLPILISVFNLEGISSKNNALAQKERKAIINSYLPTPIQNALIGETELERMIHSLNRNSLYYQYLTFIIKLIIKAKKLF